MADKLSIGAEAPNFDLSSTEDVVLMLCDEIARMAVLVYFFGAPTSDRSRQDLQLLASSQDDLAGNRVVVMGVSRTKLPGLKEIQRELNLRFPLLTDDRDFSSAYGVETPEEGDTEPALFLIDRDQKVIWKANPVASMETALKEATTALQGQPAPTYHYPSKVVNRVVNWWVNRIRPRPAA